ncbi:hypothetical protein [Intestinimonas butyriciproducens]|uniref:hypothetical protein n=1 Tax=Intestinimonas butyriciproducens TaxID=1297617 RepID=UPI00189B42DC|nr:hypothetical protein [Intestinimonas butyriciproducens]MDB7829179.1 hypothetical protein [Intestinimonas butyriciproducens]
MHAIMICITASDLDKLVKEKLNDADAAEYADCEWVPAKVSVTDLLGIDVIAVPAK